MKIQDILKKQGELYKDLPEDETIKKCGETIKKPGRPLLEVIKKRNAKLLEELLLDVDLAVNDINIQKVATGMDKYILNIDNKEFYFYSENKEKIIIPIFNSKNLEVEGVIDLNLKEEDKDMGKNIINYRIKGTNLNALVTNYDLEERAVEIQNIVSLKAWKAVQTAPEDDLISLFGFKELLLDEYARIRVCSKALRELRWYRHIVHKELAEMLLKYYLNSTDVNHGAINDVHFIAQNLGTKEFLDLVKKTGNKGSLKVVHHSKTNKISLQTSKDVEGIVLADEWGCNNLKTGNIKGTLLRHCRDCNHIEAGDIGGDALDDSNNCNYIKIGDVTWGSLLYRVEDCSHIKAGNVKFHVLFDSKNCSHIKAGNIEGEFLNQAEDCSYINVGDIGSSALNCAEDCNHITMGSAESFVLFEASDCRDINIIGDIKSILGDGMSNCEVYVLGNVNEIDEYATGVVYLNKEMYKKFKKTYDGDIKIKSLEKKVACDLINFLRKGTILLKYNLLKKKANK